MIEIFTFKWGTKYSSAYVNRLYKSLTVFCKAPFRFNCITDDANGIDKHINVLEYTQFDNKFKAYSRDSLFTREKLELFNYSRSEHNLLLDLDILIHSDITELVTSRSYKPRFIFNPRGFPLNKYMKGYGQMSSCLVNSSFVSWNGDNGMYVYDYTLKNIDKIMFTFGSLDKYLFYVHARKGNLDFWDDGIFYNYNYENTEHLKDESRKVVLFNTSHIKGDPKRRNVFELHEAEGWARELWESYDE